jgi:hypothetical protein
MNNSRNPTSSRCLMFVVLAGGLMSSCAKSSNKEAAQPAVAATPVDGEGDLRAASAAEALPAAPPVGPSPKKREQSPGSLDAEADGEPKSAAAEESSVEAQAIQAEPTDSLKALQAQMDALDVFLAPGELSCGSARPHLDAICSIAERLCGEDPDSLHKDEDCKSATQSCQNAKKRFRLKCS